MIDLIGLPCQISKDVDSYWDVVKFYRLYYLAIVIPYLCKIEAQLMSEVWGRVLQTFCSTLHLWHLYFNMWIQLLNIF